MTEPMDLSSQQVQKALKPKIEDVIPVLLGDDVAPFVLEFVAYMRANRMQPAWSAYNSWAARYKGKKICTIRLPLPHGPYQSWVVVPHISRWNKQISSYDLYEAPIAQGGLQEMVWDHVNFCRRCANCGPGWDMAFLGRAFKDVCHNVPVWYPDPNEAELDFIKKVLAWMQGTLQDGKG